MPSNCKLYIHVIEPVACHAGVDAIGYHSFKTSVDLIHQNYYDLIVRELPYFLDHSPWLLFLHLAGTSGDNSRAASINFNIGNTTLLSYMHNSALCTTLSLNGVSNDLLFVDMLHWDWGHRTQTQSIKGVARGSGTLCVIQACICWVEMASYNEPTKHRRFNKVKRSQLANHVQVSLSTQKCLDRVFRRIMNNILYGWSFWFLTSWRSENGGISRSSVTSRTSTVAPRESNVIKA